MSLESSVLAVFDDETEELADEYHMEEICDDFTTAMSGGGGGGGGAVSYTHLRAHETPEHLGTVNICIFLLCPILFIITELYW